MSKKILLISAAAIIGGGALVGGGAGIAYQVKWTQFKNDFDSQIKASAKAAGPFASAPKLISTSGHTVVYKMNLMGVDVLASEHYSAFSKFDYKSSTTTPIL